ncbi:ureidoglycolate lyase [Calidifontimicrobium sp. SYSU G02091]|uniref:ureidoglycolate lyase n=1 Tax=Calidifontimicrobium sp. SYSU G02091 TaxID=2926421 RepID=UPI001F536501|nr:ureidoglycolate lyase [Calidifontimicrobium sp. SYSU G02091]
MSPTTLRARPIAADAFAPYGWVVDPTAQAPGAPINAGTSERLDGFGALALTADGGAPCLAVFRARAQPAQGPWQVLERHRLGTQTFVPLGGARCLVVVALGADAPDPATLAAFVVGGRQAFKLHAGTWHHGLIALDDGDFVVVERRAATEDCEVVHLPAPVRVQWP